MQLLRLHPGGETGCSTEQSLIFLHLYMLLSDEHFPDLAEHIILYNHTYISKPNLLISLSVFIS